MGTIVTAENFARAETNQMFVSLIAQAGGINRWHHSRQPTPIDQQPVVRMNRDTLYSLAVVDISEGATVTLPDAGARYLSVMVVNEDHFINDVFHDPGSTSSRSTGSIRRMSSSRLGYSWTRPIRRTSRKSPGSRTA